MIFGTLASPLRSQFSFGGFYQTEFRSTQNSNGGKWSFHPNVNAAHTARASSHSSTSSSKAWREFDGWFDGATPTISINDTIPDRLKVWARRTQQTNKAHLSHVLSYLILWFLWAERNRSRHQMVKFKPFNVVWQVHMYVRNSMASGTIKPKHWKSVKLKMNTPSEAELRPPRPLAVMIKWYPPDSPWIKVNTDGAYVETTDTAEGGGIIRNSEGKMITAFAAPLDAHLALEAELKAISLGLTLATEYNLPI